MKRALLFALLLTLLLGFQVRPVSAQESALDWNVGGSLRVRGFGLRSGTRSPPINAGVDSGDEASLTFMDTRLRLQLKVTAYQEVVAFGAVEVGDIRFGDDDPSGVRSAGGLGSDGVIYQNKNLYLEWQPRRYSFRVRAGLYPRESDPYGIILSDDVAGVRGEVELLGLDTTVYADVIKAVENSRNDLDGDGEIDNDFNDRTIFIAGVTNNSLDDIALELFGVADIDNSLDTPLPTNSESDIYWLGLTGRTTLGPVSIASTWIGAYGRRQTTGTPAVRVRALALDQRIKVELPFVTLEGIFAWASGTNPRSRTTDEGFPVIAPFYGVSEIVYQALGGFNVSRSRLSGTAHATIKARATPADGFDVELVVLYAWFTSDRDVSANVIEFDDDARDIGLEIDLNLTYEIVEGFKVYSRGAILFPGKGYRVENDTNKGGTLAQIILGAQFSF